MKFLALDTSTQAFSVAVFDGEKCLVQHQLAPRLHAKLLLPTVNKLLAEAELSLQQLDGIAFGRGPGAFTGVRIAAAAVQGLALGADIGVAPISSLAIVAQRALYEHSDSQAIALAAFDARMGEIYAACFGLENGAAQLIGAEQVAAPESFQIPNIEQRKILAVSDGWVTYPEALRLRLGEESQIEDFSSLLPNAEFMRPLVAQQVQEQGWLPPERAEPVYLRNNVAVAKDKSL